MTFYELIATLHGILDSQQQLVEQGTRTEQQAIDRLTELTAYYVAEWQTKGVHEP
jgi:hypothetical protein